MIKLGYAALGRAQHGRVAWDSFMPLSAKNLFYFPHEVVDLDLLLVLRRAGTPR
jgi:hypothetical protein